MWLNQNYVNVWSNQNNVQVELASSNNLLGYRSIWKLLHEKKQNYCYQVILATSVVLG